MVTNGRALASLGSLGHIPKWVGWGDDRGRNLRWRTTSRGRFAQSGTGGLQISRSLNLSSRRVLKAPELETGSQWEAAYPGFPHPAFSDVRQFRKTSFPNLAHARAEHVEPPDFRRRSRALDLGDWLSPGLRIAS